MIIWINGAFGGGKTIVSHELRRRLGQGWIVDPEPLGFALRRMHPTNRWGDFQDYPQWRSSVREHVADVEGEVAPEPVIVPMALLDPDYFTEIVGGLRDAGHDVCHIALQARPDTIRRRLRSRGLGLPGRDLWAERQIDRAVAALARPELAVGVPTDDLSVAQVVERVAAIAGLPLKHPSGGRVASLVRNTVVSVRHIRW